MPIPTPVPGLVIGYAYLWLHEHSGGAEEARKDRPCAIVVTTTDADGDTLVYVAPITHIRPRAPGDGVEIPRKVKRHLGLDEDSSWIVTNELNRFIWPGYDLRPIARDKPDTFAFGFLPVDLFDRVKGSILAHRARKTLRAVPRS